MAIKLVEIELSEQIGTLLFSEMERPEPYEGGLALVRAFGCALGYVELAGGGDLLEASAVAQQVWVQLAGEIQAFCAQNGLDVPESMTISGLSASGPVTFLEERRHVLANAPAMSIVISTRNRPKSVAETIEHMLEIDYPDYEIIIVDNAPSSDDTRAVVESVMARDSRVRYVCEPRPGLSRGRNAGLDIARGECVVFTDDDVLPDRHYLTEVARGFAAGSDVACVTGMIAPRELETRAQIIMERAWTPNRSFERRLFDLKEHRHENPLYPFAAGLMGGGGANMSFRADVIRELGAFDVALGAGTPARGGEDLDAVYRVVRAGYQVAYEPSAIVYHAHYADYDTLHRQLYGYGFGLAAYLAKTMLSDWRNLPRFLSLIPRGAYHMLSPQSHKNRRRDASYPSQLARHEFWGMVNGPLGYRRSLKRKG